MYIEKYKFVSEGWGFMGRKFVLVVAAFLTLAASAFAQDKQVTLAGMAYSGTDATIQQRFPYSAKYAAALEAAGTLPYQKLLAAVQATPPSGFRVVTTPIDDLKGKDQALVTALVLGSETVSIERFGETRKLFVLVRAQALFFDFKSLAVLRAYPVSFGYIDNFDRDPTEQEKLERVRMVFEGAGGRPGLFARFAEKLAAARLPDQAPLALQVSHVSFTPEMLAVIPDYLKSSPEVYETWGADLVSEAVSAHIGVPMVPYLKGQAVGRMSMQVMNGDVYNLALPKPDYEISVAFKGVKKLKFSESAGGSSFIYGTFADIAIREPVLNKTYLSTALKNGETKIVPASQTYVDDFPAFYDSLNRMFVKLADTVAGKGTDWLKSAAAAPDILSQIAKTKELMDKCK